MKLKKIISAILLVIIIAMCLYFTFKTGEDNVIYNADSEKITVVVTTFSAYDFVRQIAGDNVNLIFLLGPRNRFSFL